MRCESSANSGFPADEFVNVLGGKQGEYLQSICRVGQTRGFGLLYTLTVITPLLDQETVRIG